MTVQPTFSDILTQHLPFLNRVVCSLTKGDQMTEDIVQQTLMKALMHADQFRSESTLRTWLVSIAINEVHQAYRCKWRSVSVPLMESRHRVIASPKDTPEAKERELILRDAVSRLPIAYRSVVELCDFQDLQLKEAASLLGLTLPTIKTRRHRARQKLRRLVAKLQAPA